MKYLKHFESYKTPGKLPLQEINKEEFKDLLQVHCKQFLKVAKDIDFNGYGPTNLLYRKFKSNQGHFILTNPKESEHRRIAPWSDCGNWHNLIVSNLDSWRDYPRRNKSMISSGWRRASGHGGSDMYLVIPFDTTKIGICRGGEFWEAFNVYKSNRIYINDWAKQLVHTLSNQVGTKFQNDDSWEDLFPYLDKKYNFQFFDGYVHMK